jgi:hypothetical protein
MRHEEPQQFSRRYAKGALGRVELDVYLSQVDKCFLQILDEGVTLASLDYDVINVGFCIPSHLRPQGLMHEPLEGGSCILQAEGHTDVAVHPTGHDEGGFLLVLLSHLDLMIAGESIQEAKEVAAGGEVDDLIYPRERIRILGTSLVETCEVHAEVPTAVGLWDDHRISNPGGVANLAY